MASRRAVDPRRAGAIALEVVLVDSLGRASVDSKSRSSVELSPRRRSAPPRRRRAAKAAGASKGRRRPPRPPRALPRGRQARRGEVKTVAEFREALRKNLIRPRGMVLLSRERIEEALGEAVKNGQITAKGARSIRETCSSAGASRPTTCSRTWRRCSVAAATRSRAAPRAPATPPGAPPRERAGQAADARSRATRAASPALAQVDRARRSAAWGPTFPIIGVRRPQRRARSRVG